ncbi:MAG: type II toxin-antitoxin system RelE/ParE family toxin [Candidatus Iainarchaeum archaeon]|uniref:Type II toxin-antitoxin system RelE/ParE family toxin n=1 Tax=Candidatus Iainarchaeum sp. TaxID=3101447 RepID=A0A7T9DJ00_9ARCH|nr:MAG: type II toxin-antitoxin system RelE/ParE family toxin [Candidatus Diapherotrites archaeon]
MPFILIWADEAKKDLKKLETHIAQRIFLKINDANATDSLLLEKMKGRTDYKYRVGDYRVFFSFKGNNTYLVVAIEKRENAYN